jgi:hypothetical protein
MSAEAQMSATPSDMRPLARRLEAAGLSDAESSALARLIRAEQEREAAVERQLAAVRVFAEADGRSVQAVLRDAVFVDSWRRNKAFTALFLVGLATLFVLCGVMLQAELAP